MKQTTFVPAFVLLAIAATGCAGFQPRPIEEVPFLIFLSEDPVSFEETEYLEWVTAEELE
jgi:hypothetical protein